MYTINAVACIRVCKTVEIIIFVYSADFNGHNCVCLQSEYDDGDCENQALLNDFNSCKTICRSTKNQNVKIMFDEI